jgi:hypothetical protein
VFASIAALPELVGGLTTGDSTSLLAYVDVVDIRPQSEKMGKGKSDGDAGDVEELLAGEGHLRRG